MRLFCFTKYLSIYLSSIYLSIIYQSIYLIYHLPTYLSTYVPIHLLTMCKTLYISCNDPTKSLISLDQSSPNLESWQGTLSFGLTLEPLCWKSLHPKFENHLKGKKYKTITKFGIILSLYSVFILRVRQSLLTF
jgi:hypothetical protein